MNATHKLLFAFIILQNTIYAQISDCLMVTNIEDNYDAFNECVTFNITNKSDSTISCIIIVQEYRYSDSSWFESWEDINLKKITSCKPPHRIFKFNAGSTTELQWCPKDCINYFGGRWVEEKIRGQEEKKVRLCRFAFIFYMYHPDTWKIEKQPYYYSKTFHIITQ